MRKLSVCLFYGLCVFTIVFSLFWMALPKLPLSQSPAGSETDPASPLSLAAQAGGWRCTPAAPTAPRAP